MAIPLDRIANMPAFSPYYPMPPARYRNVRFQYVYFRAGDGVVQFNPSPIYDLSDFTPRECYGAHYLEMDYTEGYAEIVHDFLHGT